MRDFDPIDWRRVLAWGLLCLVLAFLPAALNGCERAREPKPEPTGHDLEACLAEGLVWHQGNCWTSDPSPGG